MADLRVRDVFAVDPLSYEIPNEGTADVNQGAAIVWELRNFVCEGQYAAGMERILSTYLGHQGSTQQPGVWVSGFYGSGKSHLVKVLRYLWRDDTFADGASARGLAKLPADVQERLKELSTIGKRGNGLHAAAGKLQHARPLRLDLLAILFRSAGMPEEYPIARFVIWMRDSGVLDAVREYVSAAGKQFDKELRNMYVSGTLAQALLAAMPDFAADTKEARAQLRAQYPPLGGEQDITDEQMLNAIRDLLAPEGELPCMLIVLDELQQYIGDDGQRATDVQYVAEACTKQFGDRLLFVGTGQSALSATPILQKLQHRFTVKVELADTDVEKVTRSLVLAKAPDRKQDVELMLTTYSGEIDQHLAGTKIGPRKEDRDVLVADYPILPVRRRFWERVLRAVDREGTTAQLRTQLRIAHEAARDVADRPLGAVVASDFIYDQLSTPLLQSGVLLRDIYDTILRHREDGQEGVRRSRLCALCFLISQLPREAGADIGVRATPDMLADLMVDDLRVGGTKLRERVPQLLAELEQQGDLMLVGDEYLVKTQQGAAWLGEYNAAFAAIKRDGGKIAEERGQLLEARCRAALQRVKLSHGRTKMQRSLDLSFGSQAPKADGVSVPVWVRDGWSDSEKKVLNDAREAGAGSPVVFVFLPRHASDQITQAVASWKAAQATLNLKGVPSTAEGLTAREAMATRGQVAKKAVEALLNEVLAEGKVLQGGGTDVVGITLDAAVEEAAKRALVRLYPDFATADDPNWAKVFERARNGDAACLEAVKHYGETQDQPVCKAVMEHIGPGKKGREVRQHFRAAPCGWSQDAVDGALLALAVGDLLAASENSAPVAWKALDHTKIGVADFRPVKVQFMTLQRIAVRKLLQDAGVGCKPNEELAKIPDFIGQMLALATAAGGEPPAPAKPPVVHLEDLKALTGNEQGVGLYDMRERLTGELQAWRARGAAIRQRLPRWQTLERLLTHAQGLPATDAARPQVDAIRANRALFDDPDPVAPLCDTVAGTLREAARTAHQGYQTAYAEGQARLQASEPWQKLQPAQREELMTQCGLVVVTEPKVADEVELLQSLDTVSLSDWQTLTDALLQRFQNALVAAAQLLEPEAVQVKLPSRRLASEPEVDEYLGEARKIIMDEINAGRPVIT